MIQCLKIFMEVNLLSSRATSVISFLQLKTMLEELDGSNLLSSRVITITFLEMDSIGSPSPSLTISSPLDPSIPQPSTTKTTL